MSFLKQLDALQQNSLGRLSRILLASDGTLTDVVEAAMLEPISLKRLYVETVPPDAKMNLDLLELLDLSARDRVMERRILLFGSRTGRNYVYAESFLALDRFPGTVIRALTESDAPVGRIWLEHGLEGRKELLAASCIPGNGRLAAYFPDYRDTDLVMRRYRMISGGHPVMLITEYFPATLSELPSTIPVRRS
ncbi:MAG TPA: chorismate pyruvate-lyase family protein [Acidobacteriaceae bacterium]|jgi:chorismate-pyruvate lyase|nr:chorismate pyruvate-lyase family protein [Acidobacteriaceae bacterium]